MQPQSRFGDRSEVPADSHGKPCCAHAARGPAQTASEDVIVNGLGALRVSDTGIHSKCCGANTWIAVKGSDCVQINNLAAHRLTDQDQHCGGSGYMIEASPDVFVGDGTEGAMGQAKDQAKGLTPICNGA